MKPTPEHVLQRDGAPALRPADAREERPAQAYACSCGVKLNATSRRKARGPHRAHRMQVLKAVAGQA